jgi:hypothetical protein
MRLKTVLAAFVLAALPGFALAQGCHGEQKMSTSVCADGQSWDATTQTCVDTTA